MKKFREQKALGNIPERNSKVLKKLFLMTKITIFCFFLTIVQVMAVDSYAQMTRMSLKVENERLENVFIKIEKESEFFFLYNKDLIDVEQKVSVSAQNETVKAILEEVLSGKDIAFTVFNRQIVLSNIDMINEMVAQQNPVSGTVSDTDGQPLPGVTVVVKGTTQGTVTNADGNYSLSNIPEDATLVFSFVGMRTQEVVVGDQTRIDVAMEVDAFGIEEVVAIGYGTVKKSDLTGAIGSVAGDVISERQTVQISQALQGTMPGVMVTRNNNAPGSTATIRIRGITTIGENDPLVIVDGVPINNLNDVNPNDVESISVLKDAASASIYGSRAAAGVILITTKRAKTGDLGLNYNYEYGFEQATNLPEYADAVRYMKMVNEIAWNDTGNGEDEYPTYAKDVIDNYTSLNASDPDRYPDTDWTNLILNNTSPRQSHIFSLSAGTKSVKTKASLAYDNTEALYQGFNYERITARFNNDVTINKFLSASLDIYAKRTSKNQPIANPIGRTNSAPVYAAEWSDGRVAEGKQGDNIYGRIKYGGFREDYYNQLGGKIALNFTPVDGLKLTGVVSPVINNSKSKGFTKQLPYYLADDPTVLGGYIQNTTSLSEGRGDNNQMTIQFLLNYMKNLGSHNFNIMGGYENYTAFYESMNASSDQFELTTFPYLDLGNDNYRYNGGNAYENAYRSYFGRIMYNYNSKYLLQSNFRYDGSSRFHQDYRWGVFPSFSAGWVVSEESFMQGLSSLSFLKLRASWGALGNERIGNYPYQATIAFGSALFYEGTNIVSAQTAAQMQYAIRDISWEKTESFDIGLDASFFDHRLRLTGDYYKKITKDMLLALEIPDFMGFGNPDQNTGNMNTTGWELELGFHENTNDLKYSVSFNVSDFKSVMGDLGGTEFLDDQVKFEGSEFNEWYGYTSDGLFQTEDEIANSPLLNSSSKPGEVKYKDISGPEGIPDGIISPEYDRGLLGGSLPRFLYGGNIQLDYNNFDLAIAFQGVGKQNARIEQTMARPYRERWLNMPLMIDGKYWSKYNTDDENLKAKYPRMTDKNAGNNYAMSDYWLFNGAYFRLKNITLGYKVPEGMSTKIGIQRLRFYTSVSDIISINNYPKGWDPEATVSRYPITSAFIFGVSVNF